jgi:hypothetical protein
MWSWTIVFDDDRFTLHRPQTLPTAVAWKRSSAFVMMTIAIFFSSFDDLHCLVRPAQTRKHVFSFETVQNTSIGDKMSDLERKKTLVVSLQTLGPQ